MRGFIILIFVLAAAVIETPLCTADQYDRIVPAKEIFDKIESNEPVDYDHITVIGDLKLNQLDINVPIRINDSRFYGVVSFNYSTFNDEINLMNSYFTQRTYFRGAQFWSDANFQDATFSEYADFENVRFYGNVDFSGSDDFEGATFNRDANFRNAAFCRDAKFSWVLFSGLALFNPAYFGMDANFKGATFNRDADFWGAEFSGKAIFFKSKFVKYSYFNDCLFNKTADFSDTKFEDSTIFIGAQFKGILFLDRADYNKLYIRWENIKELHFDDTAYLLLIENFKKLGLYFDADQCYVSYKIKNRSNLPVYYRPIDWMLWILYGYATKPELPIIWSLIVIFLCGAFFYSTPDIETADKKTTVIEALYLSATAFTSGARTLGGFISTPEDITVRGRARYVLAFEKILGMILFGLFLTALARTVIR